MSFTAICIREMKVVAVMPYGLLQKPSCSMHLKSSCILPYTYTNRLRLGLVSTTDLIHEFCVNEQIDSECEATMNEYAIRFTKPTKMAIVAGTKRKTRVRSVLSQVNRALIINEYKVQPLIAVMYFVLEIFNYSVLRQKRLLELFNVVWNNPMRKRIRTIKHELGIYSCQPCLNSCILDVANKLTWASGTKSDALLERARKYSEQIMLFNGLAEIGGKPSSIAAAIVYLAGHDLNRLITQKQVSIATKKSEVTIRNNIVSIVRFLRRKGIKQV